MRWGLSILSLEIGNVIRSAWMLGDALFCITLAVCGKTVQGPVPNSGGSAPSFKDIDRPSSEITAS